MQKLVFIVIFGLFGCATNTLNRIEKLGIIQYESSSDPDFDFTVSILGVKSFGWNGESQKDRQDMIVQKYAKNCKSIVIAQEQALKPKDRDYNVWIMRVKCIKF